MDTIVSALADTFEALLVLLCTFVVAVVLMSAFGGLGATEVRLAAVEAVAACVLWLRLSASAASR